MNGIINRNVAPGSLLPEAPMSAPRMAVGQFAPGTPQNRVMSAEDKAEVYQPTVKGPDLLTQLPAQKTKSFADLEATLQRYKQSAPKTQEELVEANSAWQAYSDIFSNGQGGKEPGRYDGSLRPQMAIASNYSQFGAANQMLNTLSQQAAAETTQGRLPGRSAQELNETLEVLEKNPLVQQVIDKVMAIDPKAKISSNDVLNLAGEVKRIGAEYAIANFLKDKQNMAGFGTNDWNPNKGMEDATFARYQQELNQGAQAKPAPQKEWDKNVKMTSGKNEPAAVWRDATTGAGIGVSVNKQQQPTGLVYYDPAGVAVTSSAFDAPSLFRTAEKYGIDLSKVDSLGSMLERKGIKYKPYELFSGTLSELGIDFSDVARGGMGTAYDWTKDEKVAEKGDTAAARLAADQALFNRRGLRDNNVGRGLINSSVLGAR